MEVIYLIGILFLPTILGLGYVFRELNKPKINKKIATFQIGDNSKLIRISTVILNRPKRKIKTKGLFIHATHFKQASFWQISHVVPLTEQEIESTIQEANSGLPIYISWGKNPEIKFKLDRDYNATLWKQRRGLFGELFSMLSRSYWTFEAEGNSSSTKTIINAFKQLQRTDTSASYEM